MATPRKPSLFAQRMKDCKVKVKHDAASTGNMDAPVGDAASSGNMEAPVVLKSFGDKSNILQGPDASIIHQENVEKLASMTSSEIEEERSKLLANMEPGIIQFLKSRKSQSQHMSAPNESCFRKNVMSNRMECCDNQMAKESPAAKLVNQYPHMNVVEPEKLQWMEDVPPSKPLSEGCPYNARFSFEGELLPYCDDKLADGLHHHGEEPDRPGYTLQELMQLSRSSMLQQRITAISTLANIFHKASDYDFCLEKPLLPQLLDSELYLLLRFTLDDTVRSVVSAAVAAISNLLVNIKDEGCLDRLLGLSTGTRQPSFYVHLDIKPNELAELKDTELLKVDVIRGVLQTHLLPRFRYILDRLNPEPVEIGHITRCLIRIARHSYEAALKICNTSGLLNVVRKLLDCAPPQACSDALKLFRVLACQSQSLAAQLQDNYSIIQPIQRFIAGSHEETTMSLTLESFYTWNTFLSYHQTINYIPGFTPVMQRLMVTYTESVSLDSSGADLEHAAALVSWITCAFRVDRCSMQCFLPALQLCALKWLSQASQISPIKWAACKLLEAVLNALALLSDLQGYKNMEIQQKVYTFLSSDSFTHLCHKLRKCSWLLEGEKNPSVVESLPCLGSVPPTLYDNSPMPLIMGLALYVYALRSPQLSEKFSSAEGIQRYMDEVTAGVRTTTAHWFARQEIALIFTLLQIHINVQSHMETNLLHQAALFLTTSIHADDRYLLADLFDQVVFNKHFFRPDISDITGELQNIHLNSDQNETLQRRPKLLNEALDSLETISRCYQKELGILGLGPICPPPSLTASFQGTEPALPTDWHFLPIVHLNNIDGQREDAVSLAVCCLQWSLVLECLRPQFVSNLSVASRYCRLACVLLAGNDLFQDIRELLDVSLQALLDHNERIKFDKPIPGLTSFYDFYRQILEQFVGVSYGDPVFGRFVLIPLQQRHSIELRKLVWCEMGAVLRFLSTPIDKVGVPLANFLEPCERDLDLLLTYLKALGLGRVKESFCPVLYRVAVHHVATFVHRYAEQPPSKRLGQMIVALGNEDLKNVLLSYCSTS